MWFSHNIHVGNLAYVRSGGLAQAPPPAATRQTPYSHRRCDSAAIPVHATLFKLRVQPTSGGVTCAAPSQNRGRRRAELGGGLASSEIILIHSSASTLITYSAAGAAGAAKVTGGGEEAGEELPRVFGVKRVCHVKPQAPRGIKRALSAQSSPRKRLPIICSH